MKKKEKKHRHKWEQNNVDCPFCGGGEYVECECGEAKKIIFLENGRHKLESL